MSTPEIDESGQAPKPIPLIKPVVIVDPWHRVMPKPNHAKEKPKRQRYFRRCPDASSPSGLFQ